MTTRQQAVPLLVVTLLFSAANIRAQGRGTQTAAPAPAAATPAAQTPATPPAPAPGRGGLAGPGPAVGGEIDETPVVTHHRCV